MILPQWIILWYDCKLMEAFIIVWPPCLSSFILLGNVGNGKPCGVISTTKVINYNNTVLVLIIIIIIIIIIIRTIIIIQNLEIPLKQSPDFYDFHDFHDFDDSVAFSC